MKKAKALDVIDQEILRILLLYASRISLDRIK